MTVKNNHLDYAVMRKNLEKDEKYAGKLSQFRNAAVGLATAASLAGAPNVSAKQMSPDFKQEQKVQQTQEVKPSFDPKIRKQNILRSIAQVESSGGQNTQHARLPQNSIHKGERAFGTYGLTPLLIRETAGMHKDILEKHPNLNRLRGQEMHEYMKQNPQLEKEIASRHYDRLSKKFGHDPSKIGYAWLNGITGTMRALNRGAKLDKHWHVQKINNALEQIRATQQKPNVVK